MRRLTLDQQNMELRTSLLLTLLSLAPVVLLHAAQYADKEDKNTNYVIEPALSPGTPSLQRNVPGEYPYYGNAPDELLPYRNIEPYYRYWLTRLPFRGPGRNYPIPPDLKSLKVGLLSPPPYGPE